MAAEELSPLSRMLSDDEVAKAARLRFERDRRRLVAARARLREALARRLGVPPGWRIESFVPAAGYVAALAWQRD